MCKTYVRVRIVVALVGSIEFLVHVRDSWFRFPKLKPHSPQGVCSEEAFEDALA